MKPFIRYRYSLAAVVLILLVASTGSTQTEENEGEAEVRNEFGIFAGALVNIEAGETAPSIGLDYTREVSPLIGVGFQAEFAKAGGRETLVAGTVVIRPAGELRLVLAPGIIVEKEVHESGGGGVGPEETRESEGESSRKALWAFRFGLGYEIERPNVVVAPSVFVDFLDGGEDAVDVHVVFGISIGFPF